MSSHGRYQTSEAYQENMLKLSKTTLLVIAVGAFVIISATLGAAYSQRAGELNELNEKLALSQSNLQRVQLDKLSSEQKELEGQLTQATSQLEAVKAVLSQPVGSVAASNTLFSLAKSYELEVTEVTSPGPSSASLEEIACSAISLSARLEGEVPNLVSFVTELNTSLPTGVIKSMTITVPETTSEEKASVDIQWVVYTYQGE